MKCSLLQVGLAGVVTAMCCGCAAAQVPAFPGAEGFGAMVSGGRAGGVYHVTTLADSGPGSFRDAVSESNRTIVFDVGGYIELESTIEISASNLTIAGQTAPGEGITVRNYMVLFKNAENIIVRYMRFRHGLDTTGNGDSLSVTTSKNLIFDHISTSWGRDENFSVTKSENVTLQYCIIGEGLLPHSMGGLIEWNTISLHHCLFISNNDRNPKAKGKIDFVNNVVYNWGGHPFVAGDSAGVSEVNMVNNIFIAGPGSTRLDRPITRGNANFHLYMDGNLFDGDQDGQLNPVPLKREMVEEEATWVDSRYEYPSVSTHDAREAYERVLRDVGASLFRDAIDRRLIAEVTDQSGQIIADPDEAGGYPGLAGGAAPTDTDGDGMPDDWEAISHHDAGNPEDAHEDLDHDGYTNLEEYLHARTRKLNP